MRGAVDYEALGEQELMGLVAEDDEEAFEVLVTRFWQPGLWYCLKLVADKSSAQDIVWDSFADIYVQRRAYRPSYSFQAYLYGMIRYKAVDLRRKNARVTVMEDELLLERQKDRVMAPGDGADLSPEEVFIRQEDRSWLYECMGRLKEDYKKALYMYSVEDMSYAQIARKLGKSVAQVKIYIYRGRKALKKSMENAGGEGVGRKR